MTLKEGLPTQGQQGLGCNVRFNDLSPFTKTLLDYELD